MKRHNPADRRQLILTAALANARDAGLAAVTRASVAERAGVTAPLVSHYFGTMNLLNRAIVGEAIRLRDLRVIGQAIVAREPRALRLDDDTKRAAVGALCE